MFKKFGGGIPPLDSTQSWGGLYRNKEGLRATLTISPSAHQDGVFYDLTVVDLDTFQELSTMRPMESYALRSMVRHIVPGINLNEIEWSPKAAAV